MKDNFVAIIDYGLGNLFSVEQACRRVGLNSVITSSPRDILDSSAVILVGVGAFGRAMEMLTKLGLVDVLRDYALSGKPLVGICLGMQLLMTESEEFGVHFGLDILEGKVKRLEVPLGKTNSLKIPHIGWNKIYAKNCLNGTNGEVCGVRSWTGTLLEDIPNDAQMYFVHSYFVETQDKDIILSMTRYGHNEFCSGIQKDNIFAFQFHPECSGHFGLKIYANLAENILGKKGGLHVWRKN